MLLAAGDHGCFGLLTREEKELGLIEFSIVALIPTPPQEGSLLAGEGARVASGAPAWASGARGSFPCVELAKAGTRSS